MDIRIVENHKNTLCVEIQCIQMSDEIIRLKKHIELFDQKLQAKKESTQYFISTTDVLYFESVDNHTFLYMQHDVMKIKQRLYELEYFLSHKDFIRISKSLIVNINKISSLRPELNRTILVTMCNGERLYISRRYVPSIRKILSV